MIEHTFNNKNMQTMHEFNLLRSEFCKIKNLKKKFYTGEIDVCNKLYLRQTMPTSNKVIKIIHFLRKNPII